MTWYGITVTAQNKPTAIALEARQARRRRGHATKSATFAVANGTATNSPIRISSTVCAHTATVATAKSRSSRRSTLQMRRPAESATGDAGGAAPAFSFIAPPLPRRRHEVEREPQARLVPDSITRACGLPLRREPCVVPRDDGLEAGAGDRDGRSGWSWKQKGPRSAALSFEELAGLEPATSSVRSRRQPSPRVAILCRLQPFRRFGHRRSRPWGAQTRSARGVSGAGASV